MKKGGTNTNAKINTTPVTSFTGSRYLPNEQRVELKRKWIQGIKFTPSPYAKPGYIKKYVQL